MIDTESTKRINVADYPEFEDMLLMPICGEPRLVYCYVKPWREKEFESYVSQHFIQSCELHKSLDLYYQWYFWNIESNPKFFDRIGDYTLIMKDNYVMMHIIPWSDVIITFVLFPFILLTKDSTFLSIWSYNSDISLLLIPCLWACESKSHR